MAEKMSKRSNSHYKLLKYIAVRRTHLCLFLILAPAFALVEVGLAYVMSDAIDYAMGGELSDIGHYIRAFALYIAMSFATGYGYKSIRRKLMANCMTALKTDVHSKIIKLPFDKFQEKNSAEYISMMTTNMDIVQDSYFNIILSLYPEMLQFLVSTIAMFLLAPVLGIYVLLLAVGQMLVPSIFTERIARKGKLAADSQKEHVVVLKENFQSFETARLFHIMGAMNDRQAEKCKKAEKAKCDSKLINALSYELSFVIGNGMYLGIYLIGAWLAIQGRLDISAIICASQLMVYITSPLTTISADLAELKSASRVAADLSELLATEIPESGNVCKEVMQEGILLDDVSFSYGECKVLSHINYYFEKGKKYIVLGESGCGKSTLLQLLTRLNIPESGTIRMDGMDINCINEADYANIVCCIPQEPFLYDATLEENVKLFRKEGENEIIRALEKAGLGEYLKKSADGIYAKTGENGMQISGGEKQRISIARVLLKNGSVILMDESTSHLDPDTAKEIERIIFTLSDVTVIFVTHALRPETKKLADKTLKLIDGRLNEI